jgi:hypothetical protein
VRATLQAESARFLREHGPSTGTEIALGIRARRDDVDRILVSDGFCRVPPPVGGKPRGVYFNVSRPVRRTDGRLRGRAQRMLDVLRDGQPHSRDELATAGVGNYPNNAAAELRAAGYDVRYRRRDGVSLYQLITDAASEAVAA